MLVEKFDFIELLRLAIAQGKAEGKKISKDVVLGELALLSPAAKLWATVLIEKVDFERIAIITPAQKQTETFYSKYDFNFQTERRIEDIPGKVEFVRGEIKSGDFFRARNKLAVKIHEEMVKKKFTPTNAQGDLTNLAKGIAEVVLRGHVFVKAMCSSCQGIGKIELFNSMGYPDGSKFCEKCNGTGKRPYTLNEKMKLAGISATKTAYIKSYQKFELFGESIVAEWENEIRSRISRSFRFELPDTQETCA
ncbi:MULTISPECIES: hypothetical protein [Acinetobacter calcoaceticus/baumannii complex]|jgi:hypothetical protein|uniref:hypothetical protein n=1 Tax=Acinetobacter calcoaceticus/baumannii complex TaxID=909768 RepID=UPI0022656B50|nr:MULTISPECIES: hypothetical protein [Acinetobacter calcoaceticus/baumannii complex]MCG9496926.1 hypothetical protein [Acinetobacter pittii]MDA3528665.1 hypothetical protein [Acinetobacter baumannii]